MQEESLCREGGCTALLGRERVFLLSWDGNQGGGFKQLRVGQVQLLCPGWGLWKEPGHELDSMGSQKTFALDLGSSIPGRAWEVDCCNDSHRLPERSPDFSGTVC